MTSTVRNLILCFFVTFCLYACSDQQKNTKEATAKTISKTTTKTTSKTSSKVYKGMFSYMADANMFVSCDKSTQLPIDMTGKYLVLEKAYTNIAEGGKEVYLELKAYEKEVPAMEGDGMETALVLTEIVSLDKDKSCQL